MTKTERRNARLRETVDTLQPPQLLNVAIASLVIVRRRFGEAGHAASNSAALVVASRCVARLQDLVSPSASAAR